MGRLDPDPETAEREREDLPPIEDEQTDPCNYTSRSWRTPSVASNAASVRR